METLETLRKILRRIEPSIAIRTLLEDVECLLACDDVSQSEINLMLETAIFLRVIKGRDCIV